MHFEIRVCLQLSNSLTEILKGDVMQPCSGSGYAASDAHVLSCETAALEIDALRDLDFVLVVNWFEFHFGSPHSSGCSELISSRHCSQ